jgi:hypothetical protein
LFHLFCKSYVMQLPLNKTDGQWNAAQLSAPSPSGGAGRNVAMRFKYIKAAPQRLNLRLRPQLADGERVTATVKTGGNRTRAAIMGCQSQLSLQDPDSISSKLAFQWGAKIPASAILLLNEI